VHSAEARQAPEADSGEDGAEREGDRGRALQGGYPIDGPALGNARVSAPEFPYLPWRIDYLGSRHELPEAPLPRSHQLADLQYAIMSVLWREGEATVARVHEVLGSDRERALTTIATMLAKMEKKGVVAHKSVGRQFVYRAKVSEQDVRRSMVGELTRRLFRGDAAALVSHLLEEEEIDAGELERIKADIAEKRSSEKRAGEKDSADKIDPAERRRERRRGR
jgi:predicted transcriptional regulator